MNILVTAIGSFSADCVIGNLKKAGHRVIGCEIYPSTWHAASKDCDRFYQVPFSTDEDEYVSSLLNICAKEHNEDELDWVQNRPNYIVQKALEGPILQSITFATLRETILPSLEKNY